MNLDDIGFHLVTTSIEETWFANRPILFLDESCALYKQRNILSEVDHVFAEPYGIDLSEKNSNYQEILNICDDVKKDLYPVLNALHCEIHEDRYWNILIGHWLYRYVSYIHTRFNTLMSTLNSYDIASVYVAANLNLYELTPENSAEFVAKTKEPRFNYLLNSSLLLALKEDIAEPISFIIKDISPGVSDGVVSKVYRKKYRSFFDKLINISNSFFSKKNDAVILNSYLPRIEEMKLQILLQQFPAMWRTIAHTKSPKSLDVACRSQINITKSNVTHCEMIIRDYLKFFLPSIFLENYSQNKVRANSIGFPEAPNFIFTSNNFDTDEIFKIWVAAKVERGCKYIVGQHGGAYGTHLYFQTEYSPEHSESDAFLTWGWRNGNSKNIPAFIFKTLNKKHRVSKHNFSAVLVLPVLPNPIMHWDTHYEFRHNQNYLLNFYNELPVEIKSNMVVRLHHGAQTSSWCDMERWMDSFPNVTIDLGSEGFEKILEKFSLIIFGYDSTGMLECMSLNKPVIALWFGGLDHLREEVKPDYLKLYEVGILHKNPESAVRFLEDHSNDIHSWWYSKEVQDVRAIFCKKYARTLTNSLAWLKEKLETI